MRWSEQYNHDRLNGPDRDPNEDSIDVVLNGLLVFAVCVFFASHLPRALVAGSLSSMLFLASIGLVLAATIRGNRAFEDRLTHWDVAAVFVLASIVLSWFVDPAAVQAVLESRASAGGVPVEPGEGVNR